MLMVMLRRWPLISGDNSATALRIVSPRNIAPAALVLGSRMQNSSPPHPGQRVTVATNVLANGLRHQSQAFVTDLVAPGVVNPLEVIDIQQQKRQIRPIALHALQFAGIRLVEIASVARAGQCVGAAHFLQLLVGFFQFFGALAHPVFQYLILLALAIEQCLLCTQQFQAGALAGFSLIVKAIDHCQ